MIEPGIIQLSQYINHPPAKVWKALTDPEMIAKWWAPGDVRAEVGHKFTLDMGKWGQQPCEVLEVQPERLLSYSFAEGMIITWTIEPKGTGTQLNLVHSGFDLNSPLGKTAYEGMSKGWPTILERIEDAIT